MDAYLVLEDGAVFKGRGFGAAGKRHGEVVFNTSMTGYQEILTDPSYCGQIVTMTYPLIGNYGLNEEDFESVRPYVTGYVVRERCQVPSNWRSLENLDEFLKKHQIGGIEGIDTRALTRRLRTNGTMRGVLAVGDWDVAELLKSAGQHAQLSGEKLVPHVTTDKPYIIKGDKFNVVLVDFGVKHNIIRWLSRIGCSVQVVPATTSTAEILALAPDGVMLSNGPGDPKDVPYGVETVKGLLGHVPIFGICLGHQLLGMALGATTFKLPFGHRGANHPVKEFASGRVYITSQNHGYAIDPDSVKAERAEVTHINLNDNTVEGLKAVGLSAFSVQYHPESSPGPTDSEYLFYQFFDMIERFRGKGEQYEA
ncbi:glutamine-hydrolyzing carbamoyl-phosphate synthase small subunit [Metallumcola ferriviriculae]|uniref:Carbamoyl phosphate synthase small chain n=1 Tax=Metallumcola ferriviriculae TaxID=3039180 RepID=A0AAU0UPC9_9FIRM|nr:glutamine-hydrolyzing carbamoyl-phosphate synthase small subunit [Desulfitibacteraceae bacterium MK1]